jgi:hypothetical protein
MSYTGKEDEVLMEEKPQLEYVSFFEGGSGTFIHIV